MKEYRVTFTIEVSAKGKQEAADTVAAWLLEGGEEWTFGVTNLSDTEDTEEFYES